MATNTKTNRASSPRVKIQDVPDVPTIGEATAGDAEALVAFTPAVTGGKPALFRALSSPDSITATGSSSPILVPGLTNGTSYTFQVRAEAMGGATTGYSSASDSVVPESLGSFDLLETQVLASSAASVTFSSLSTYAADYQHLQLRIVARTNRTEPDEYLQLQFNNVTTSSYAWHNLNGTGSSVTSTAFSSQTFMRLANASLSGNTVTAGQFGASVTDILDPFNANKNTTVRSLSGQAGSYNYLNLNSGLFNSTASIDEIDLFAIGSFLTGSRFSLYGIKAGS